jgi:hypothetical protein
MNGISCRVRKNIYGLSWHRVHVPSTNGPLITAIKLVQGTYQLDRIEDTFVKTATAEEIGSFWTVSIALVSIDGAKYVLPVL